MRPAQKLLRGALALAIAAGAAAPSSATTLLRQSLDDLVAGNGTVVLGEVLDTRSYWNAEGTFILTDVRVAAQEILKGRAKERELTFTILGGTVGDKTVLIVGGPELIRGSSYMLFLDEEDLPGAPGARTVRDHSQGIFDVKIAKDGLRAISQASRHPLVPDARGSSVAPGGKEGLPLASMMQTVRELVDRSRREVKR
jgi:hypothetical protein